MPRRPHARARIEPAPLPQVWLASHYPPGVVSDRVRMQQWLRVGRGIYAEPRGRDEPAGQFQDRVALAAVAGVHARLSSDHWFSHQTAALLWGIPVLRTPATSHLLSRHSGGAQRAEAVTIHTGPLPAADLVMLSGLPVTSLARTVADCVATLPPAQGLVVADGALHRGLDLAALEQAVGARVARQGSARARAVLSMADDGAESPGESLVRFALVRDGLPAPATQVPVHTRVGTYWVDLGWDEWRLLFEYDGRAKYAGASDAFMAEKRRHDAITETGRRVIRVTSKDLPDLTSRVLPLLPAAVRRARRPVRYLAA